MPFKALSRTARIALAACALACLALSWWSFHLRSSARAELVAAIERSNLGEADAAAVEGLMREPDPQIARLRLARTLMSGSVAEVEPGNAAWLERIDQVADLAEQVALKRPASWQASMWRGATIYLRRSATGDPRVLTDRRDWEAPLLRAVELAPTKRSPRRLLATAYVEMWPALSAAEHSRARTVIAAAFEDEASLRELIAPWLLQIKDRDEAFALIPEDPASWRTVRTHFARAMDWEGFCAAQERHSDSLDSFLDASISEMNAALAGGDKTGARMAAISVVTMATPDLRTQPAVLEALRRMPPGPVPEYVGRAYRRWLEWGLQGFAEGTPLLPPETLERLIRGAPDVADHETGLVALASGRIDRADAVERRRDDLNTEPWAPYCLARARVMLQAGDGEAARSAYRLVHRTLRGTPADEQLRLAFEGDGSTEAAWWRKATGLARTQWSGTEWRWPGKSATLQLVAVQPAQGLGVELDVVPPRGAVIEAVVDFRGVWVGQATAGETITIPVQLSEGPHRLEIRSLAGGRVVPGDVELVL